MRGTNFSLSNHKHSSISLDDRHLCVDLYVSVCVYRRASGRFSMIYINGSHRVLFMMSYERVPFAYISFFYCGSSIQTLRRSYTSSSPWTARSYF